MTRWDHKLETVDKYLCDSCNRQPGDIEDVGIAQLLAELKSSAVDSNDQALAKTLWCLETIQHYQNWYISCFNDMKSQHYFDAWCGLAAIESGLLFLERHIELDVHGVDAYWLLRIRKSTKQFQKLYPYALFASPELIIENKTCTICGQQVSIRNPCLHRVGEIYDGEICARHVDDVRVLDIAYVNNPHDKRTVQFPIEKETGKAVDTYNYGNVYYAVERLSHPFSNWDLKVSRVKHSTSDYRLIGRNSLCPCGSEDKFKRCCMRKEYLSETSYR